jgi:hypothetical protein
MSPLRTGLAAQLGLAAESTHGTFVAPTRFLEFNSESLSMEIERLESQGLRAGKRILRSDRWAAGRKTVGGSIELDLVDTSLGLLLDHMMGGTVVTVDEGAALNAYSHTWNGPGDLPTGLSIQVGKPDFPGTVQPFSYLGCLITGWTISGEVGEIGKLEIEVDAQDESTTESLGSATYASNNLLTFVEATLTIAAGSTPIRSFDISGDNGLEVGRHFLGSQIRNRPVEAAMREYSGTVEAEFNTLADYNRFVNGTEAALVAKFEGATDIEAGFPPQLQITANVRFDGETPEVGGPDEVELSLPFKVVGNTDATAIVVKYQTSDATP